MIAPLPQDVGGTYTTGICKVVYELSRQKWNDIEIYLSSTNISQRKAKKICQYDNQYNGFRYLIGELFNDLLFHPIRTYREMKYYRDKCHVNPFKYEFYKVNIKKHLKVINPELIHVHTTACPAVFFANHNNIPILNTMHGVFYRGLPEQKKLGEFLQECANMSEYHTGLTRECEYLMTKYFSIPKEKLFIVPNGVNTDLYYYDVSERSKIREMHEVGDSVVFITVASIQERKGQLKFIKVLEKLGIDYRYWILGDGPDKQLIVDYCQSQGISDKITFFGTIESKELYKYYSAADIYAHASTMEGQALCEMEAYATGIRTIVNKEVKDTIVTDLSDKDIYYTIDMDCIDTEELSSWATRDNSHRHSRIDMSWATIAEMYSDVYKAIVSSK